MKITVEVDDIPIGKKCSSCQHLKSHHSKVDWTDGLGSPGTMTHYTCDLFHDAIYDYEKCAQCLKSTPKPIVYKHDIYNILPRPSKIEHRIDEEVDIPDDYIWKQMLKDAVYKTIDALDKRKEHDTYHRTYEVEYHLYSHKELFNIICDTLKKLGVKVKK